MNSPTKADAVKVAVVQAGSILLDTDACVEKAVRLVHDAAATGARVIVFPEAFITGYPKGLSLGCVVGARDAAGREEFRRYLDAAIDVPGRETQQLGAAAAACNSYVVIGVIERENGTCYCTVLFFAPDGRLLGKHRKLMPTASERLIWGFGDGSTLTVIDSPYGRIGSVICWENYMPMLRMAMYSKGVALYCAPTADDRDTWLPSMQHVALEGRCFVLTACQFLRKRDFPETVRVELGDSPEAVLMRGGSAIISPLGQVLAGPQFDGETILTASLDLHDIRRGKFDFDVAGHYSRPDIFQLIVNEAPTRPVTLCSGLRSDGPSSDSVGSLKQTLAPAPVT
jgi:nitrilase